MWNIWNLFSVAHHVIARIFALKFDPSIIIFLWEIKGRRLTVQDHSTSLTHSVTTQFLRKYSNGRISKLWWLTLIFYFRHTRVFLKEASPGTGVSLQSEPDSFHSRTFSCRSVLHQKFPFQRSPHRQKKSERRGSRVGLQSGFQLPANLPKMWCLLRPPLLQVLVPSLRVPSVQGLHLPVLRQQFIRVLPLLSRDVSSPQSFSCSQRDWLSSPSIFQLKVHFCRILEICKDFWITLSWEISAFVSVMLCSDCTAKTNIFGWFQRTFSRVNSQSSSSACSRPNRGNGFGNVFRFIKMATPHFRWIPWNFFPKSCKVSCVVFFVPHFSLSSHCKRHFHVVFCKKWKLTTTLSPNVFQNLKKQVFLVFLTR